MEETRRAVLLLSGGVDSALCARILIGRGYRVDCLFVDYGQVTADAERHAARRVSALLGLTLSERRLEGAPSRGDGEHVGRNALLVAAAAFETDGGPAEVVLGIHDGSGYYDCSPRFVELMDGLLREQSDGRIALSAPLLHWSKQEILSAFAGSGLPLEATHSCERSDQPCGLCRSCLDRRTY